MKLVRIAHLMVALSLAVLLPLEQAHCVWMGIPQRSAPVTAKMRPDHACCRARATGAHARAALPQPVSAGCVCAQLPAGTLPTIVTPAAPAPSLDVVALSAPATLVAPASIDVQIEPEADVGSPPLPHGSRAHGLRAPPLFA